MTSKKLNARDEKRLQALLVKLSKENESIRDAIASLWPAMNESINMRARSFTEFALREAAKEQGVYRDIGLIDYSTIIPKCPQCGDREQVNKTKISGDPFFYCKKCKFKYSANWNSLSSGVKTTSQTWLRVLRCMLDYYTMDRTCAVCGISHDTYYTIRNKLFYAMELALSKMKLFGVIQSDITFIHSNYRGMSLTDDAPEDSVFDEIDFIPRPARSRGGAYSRQEKNINAVALFTAIDDRGHVMVRFIGFGNATAAGITAAVEDKILLTVPETDPFPCANEKRISATALSANSPSLLVSDKEAAIIAFANRYGITSEAHVYQKDGKQRRLGADNHDIQRINALHRRLKLFLGGGRTNYVSTKYLPGFLTFFEWIETTGATQEAIDQLFVILSTPGLYRPPEFFAERFAIPSYLTQWRSEAKPLQRFSFNKLYAYYLYRQRKLLIDSGQAEDAMSTSEISYLTGYPEQTIRRSYKNLYNAGYDDIIMEYFHPEEVKRTTSVRIMLSPERLALYDEYSLYASKGSDNYMPMREFVEMINKRDGTSYKMSTLKMSFAAIRDSGLRAPLSVSGHFNEFRRLSPIEEKNIAIYTEYLEMIDYCYKSGDLSKTKDEIAAEIGAKYDLSLKQTKNTFAYARKAQRKLDKWKREEEEGCKQTAGKTDMDNTNYP